MKAVRFPSLLTCCILFAVLVGPVSPGSAAVKAPGGYHEAPMLAALVAAGQLPPVEQRLPADPVVITPVESVGKYGGTWHTASPWPSIDNVLLKLYDPPIRWKADYSGYEPGLAQSYEWSADGRTFTLHLREGIRWSDGAPYTSEDWRFWWEDLALNPVYPTIGMVWIPTWLRKSDWTPVDMSFPDAYTISWTSDRPQWVLPLYIAQGYWEFAVPMLKPAHYLKQFHPDYTPGATYEGLAAVDVWWQNPDFPTVFAWRCKSVEWLDEVKVSTTFERNPYYWKVDTAGNQLPYIDTLKVDIVADEQELQDRVVHGRYDAAFRLVNSPEVIPLLEANAATYGYHLQPGWMSGAGAWPGYMVDQDYVEGGGNYADDTPEHAAEIRALLRDKRFRKALSVGFDRQEVIDVAWDGHGTPQQATISPQAQHFASPAGQQVYQQWAASDATLNIAQANTWLNAIGMVDANGDGWRELPSGKPFTLIIDVTEWGGSYDVQIQSAGEMKRQWEANLDIQVAINDLAGNPAADDRTAAGYYMLRACHVSELDLWTYPDWVFPIRNQYMFPLEGLWYDTGGAAGMAPEPGSPAALLQALYEQGLAESDFEARQQIVWNAIQLHITEGPFVIGVSGDQPAPVVIKNNFHNVPEFGVTGPWAPSSPGSGHSEQFWIERPRVYLPLLMRAR